MHIQRLLGSLLVLVSIQVAAVVATTPCYFPSGDPAPGNVPCNNGTEFSSCCSSSSSCLANGLCLVNSDTDTVEYGRGGCTDPTWASEYCFPHCALTDYGVKMSNGAAVFECETVGYNNPANYCCEIAADEKTSCCAYPSLRFQLGAGLPTGTQILGSMTATSYVIPGASSSTSSITTASSSQQTPQLAATTGTGGSGNERLHDPTSSSATNGEASITSSAAQVAAALPSSSTPSSDAASISTSSNETMVIIIGVTIPIFALFTALVVFLIWNNRRNSREIRSLKDGIRYGPSSASSSYLSSPVDYKPAINVEKALPGYPQPIWRSEYYNRNQAAGLRLASSGNDRAYELPHTPDPQELDSANTIKEHNTV